MRCRTLRLVEMGPRVQLDLGYSETVRRQADLVRRTLWQALWKTLGACLGGLGACAVADRVRDRVQNQVQNQGQGQQG